jgi:hypothetical protein
VNGDQDISSMVGNVAIVNFSQAGTAADANPVNFYNSSYTLVYETKPETGDCYTVYAPDGKQYWYARSYSDRKYAYTPHAYQYARDYVIEKDGGYYMGAFIVDEDDQGNWQYDENGKPKGQWKFTEIGSEIWKQDPDNPSGDLLVDYKNTDYEGEPVFNLTAKDLGLNMGDDTDINNPVVGYSGGTNNVAVGNKAKTTHHSSVAVGDTSTARGYRSVAIGAEAEAGQENAGGDWNNGTSAVAIGDSAKAYGGTSVAVGSHAQTYSFSGVAVGNNSNAARNLAVYKSEDRKL